MVCGESEIGVDGTDPQCWPDETWAEGRALCIGAGARLCTVEELQADEAQGTGCNFDSRMVWTSDDIGCEPFQHVTIQACQNGGRNGTPLCRDGYAASAVRLTGTCSLATHFLIHSLRMPLTEHRGRVCTNNYESQ
jgi:hypothetical protein